MKIVVLASLLGVFASGVLVFANLSLYPREGVSTIGVDSFEISIIIEEKLWSESAVQIMYTYMPSGVILNPGRPGLGGFEFGDRLVARYGADRVGLEYEIADLRSVLKPGELANFKEVLSMAGYESTTACPHDPEVECNLVIAWNRDRSYEGEITMVCIRVGELEYAIVDDSVLTGGVGAG